MKKAQMYLTWEIRPFYRYWQGRKIRKILWWLWPVRWWVVIDTPGMQDSQCFCSANEAALWMCRYAMSHKIEDNADGTVIP